MGEAMTTAREVFKRLFEQAQALTQETAGRNAGMRAEDQQPGQAERVEESEQLHSRCKRCHRGLKNTESRLRGYGPVFCAIVQRERAMEKPADEPDEQQPA